MALPLVIFDSEIFDSEIFDTGFRIAARPKFREDSAFLRPRNIKQVKR